MTTKHCLPAILPGQVRAIRFYVPTYAPNDPVPETWYIGSMLMDGKGKIIEGTSRIHQDGYETLGQAEMDCRALNEREWL